MECDAKKKIVIVLLSTVLFGISLLISFKIINLLSDFYMIGIGTAKIIGVVVGLIIIFLAYLVLKVFNKLHK